MKKIILCLSIMLVFAGISNGQTLPVKITKYLNANHAGWVKAPGFCDGKKWFLIGDFDGDRQIDYAFRFKAGRNQLRLYAFLKDNAGGYTPVMIANDDYLSDLRRSSFSIIKKGSTVNLGEGEGPTVKLKKDAVSQYICETDAVKTFIYEKGEWRNIYEQ